MAFLATFQSHRRGCWWSCGHVSQSVWSALGILPTGQTAHRPYLEAVPAAQGSQLVKVRDEYMPVIELEKVFDVPRFDFEHVSSIMVVVEAEGGRVALLVDEPWAIPLPSTETIAAVIALASVSTAFAYILFFRILATAGATNLMLVTFLIPVSALALGILILGEILEVRHVIGLLCIGVGLAAIDGRLLRRR